MTGTPEDLAETPMFGTDAFSEVLGIVHVRGETARVVTQFSRLNETVPAGRPCVYIVEHGQLRLTIEGQPSVVLREKQIALMLQGTAHQAEFGAAETGGHGNAPQSGTPIQCFCGEFSADSALAARVLQTLPPVIVLDGLAEQPIEWVDVMCDLVLRELGAVRPGASLMVSRLLDLLLVVILRRWAQTADNLPGWLASAKDERIARAVSAIHAHQNNPHQKTALTNADLARIAGMSISNFADRFKQVMDQTPGAYLRAWRLDQAAEALLHSRASIDVIAEDVGYASKEAFSRAFHAKFDVTPSAWRNRT